MKEKRYIELVRTERDELLLNFGGSFIERLKMTLGYLFKGHLYFRDWTWFGEEKQ